MKMHRKSFLIAVLLVAQIFSSDAKTVFNADFKAGLPGWKVSNSKTAVTVEFIRGENAFVVRREEGVEGKGTYWNVVGEKFPVVPGRRISVFVRACSSFKTLRTCRGFNRTYISAIRWFDGEGKMLTTPFGFGYDLAANAWRYTVEGTTVPEDAVMARMEFGFDLPDFTTNDYFAVSKAYVEMSDPTESASTSSLRDDGTVLVDGKPFFPIGIYHVCECERNGNSVETAFRDLKAAGFNMVHRHKANIAEKDFLSLADRYGLKVFQVPAPSYKHDFVEESNIADYRSHPSVLAWYLADDTAGHSTPEEVSFRHRIAKALDPARLTLQADFVMMDGSNCRYPRYVHTSDVYLPELYPVFWKNPQGSEVSEIVRDMKRIRSEIEAAGNPLKSVWPIIQHFDGWGWQRFPTFAELRAMSWESIVHGGKGIVWYVYHSRSGRGRGVVASDEYWNNMKGVSSEIASFKDDLVARTAAEQPRVEILSGPVKDFYGFAPVSVLLKSGDSPLLATVNAATNAVKAVVRVNGFRTAEVVGKGVMLDATNGISDEWEPYGVRLYRLKK
jgi:hypothetical protein